MAYLVKIIGTMCFAGLLCALACVRVKRMESISDAQLVERLAATDYRVADEAARAILREGERMVEPLLRLKGRKEVYASSLGNPLGSTLTYLPAPGFPLTPEQQDKVLTVEAAALYLISAIYEGRLDFASGPLLMDLDVPADRRKAANTAEHLERGFASARAWSDALKREGLQALRARKEDPLKQGRVAFW
jgi:hypothetical protein